MTGLKSTYHQFEAVPTRFLGCLIHALGNEFPCLVSGLHQFQIHFTLIIYPFRGISFQLAFDITLVPKVHLLV